MVLDIPILPEINSVKNKATQKLVYGMICKERLSTNEEHINDRKENEVTFMKQRT